MSDITRICAKCGQSSPLEARFCPHCGYDAEAGPPTALDRRNLPVAVTRAALPVLAGVASLALRIGWKMLRSRLNTPLTANLAMPAQPATPPSRAPESRPAQRPRRVIRIRSSWAVGDAYGILRQGSSDHTIEIDD